MAHEGYVVLQLGSDVGRVEWSVDFFKIICCLVQFKACMVPTTDVTSTSVAFTGRHCDGALRVSEDGMVSGVSGSRPCNSCLKGWQGVLLNRRYRKR
jgi:hypothetical protein